MARISSYSTATPISGDLIVGTDITGNVTKNFTVGSIVSTEIPTYITGTTNTVPLFTGTNTIGDSKITQVVFDASTTAVNIGTVPTKGSGSTAWYPVWTDNFQVQGTMTSSGNVSIGTPRELLNQEFDLNLLNSNSKIAFGDNQKTSEPLAPYTLPTWNVVVGEYGTTDTDQLQLHGKEGTFFTKGHLGTDIAMVIGSSGNVGIGTSMPGSKLEVNGDVTVSGNIDVNGSIFMKGSEQITWDDGEGILSIAPAVGQVKILNGTITADYTGNVGIGTSTPGSKLDVSGDIAATNLTVTGDVTGDKFISSSNSAMFVQPSATSQFNHLRVDSILGSTFSPGVYGWQFEFDTPHASSVTFRFDNDNYRIYSAGVGEVARFTDTGNVGIGTTNPQSTLDVDGILKVRGQIDLLAGSNPVLSIFSAGGTYPYINSPSGQINFGAPSSNTTDVYVQGNSSAKELESTESAKGLILKSPDGTRYRVTVANGGTLSVSAV